MQNRIAKRKKNSSEKEIIVGSFLASEESQKTEANNFAQFSVVKRTAEKKRVETISQDNSTNIPKWFKERRHISRNNCKKFRKRYNTISY